MRGVNHSKGAIVTLGIIHLYIRSCLHVDNKRFYKNIYWSLVNGMKENVTISTKYSQTLGVLVKKYSLMQFIELSEYLAK